MIHPGSGPSGPRGESSGACHGVKHDVDLHNEVKSCGYSMKHKKADRRRERRWRGRWKGSERDGEREGGRERETEWGRGKERERKEIAELKQLGQKRKQQEARDLKAKGVRKQRNMRKRPN